MISFELGATHMCYNVTESVTRDQWVTVGWDALTLNTVHAYITESFRPRADGGTRSVQLAAAAAAVPSAVESKWACDADSILHLLATHTN